MKDKKDGNNKIEHKEEISYLPSAHGPAKNQHT
jgi:hypothetical protein